MSVGVGIGVAERLTTRLFISLQIKWPTVRIVAVLCKKLIVCAMVAMEL